MYEIKNHKRPIRQRKRRWYWYSPSPSATCVVRTGNAVRRFAIDVAGRYRHPLPQHPHHGTFSARSLMLSFRRQIVLVSLSASSVRDTDPPRCLLAIVSRLWPACNTDGRRRARSGDSPGPGVGGHPSRSLITVLDDRLGDPVDLTDADDCNDDDGAVTLGSAALGSAGNLFTMITR